MNQVKNESTKSSNRAARRRQAAKTKIVSAARQVRIVAARPTAPRAGPSRKTTQVRAVPRPPRRAQVDSKLHTKIRSFYPRMLKQEHEAILTAITLPFGAEPVRLAGPFCAKSSAVAAPYTVTPVLSLGGTATDLTSQMPASELVAFVFRDPRRAYILYDPNPTHLPWAYEFQLSSEDTGVVTDAGTAAPGNYIPVDYYANLNTYAPHGPGQVPGVYAGINFVWIDCVVTAMQSSHGTVFTMSGITSGATSAVLSIVRYQQGSAYLFATFTVTITAGAFTCYLTTDGTFSTGLNLGSGYYAFFVESIAGASELIYNQAYVTGTCSVFGHFQQPNYQNNWLAVDNHRTIAASIMYTNTASPLNRQGDLVGYQAPGSKEWYNYSMTGSVNGGAPATVFGPLSKLNGAVVLAADTGMYGFLLPSDDSELQYRGVAGSTGTTGAGTGIPLPYPLSDVADYLMLVTNITNTAGYQQGYWTFAYGCEYETDDTWRRVSLPASSPSDFQDTFAMAGRIPQWHENPMHFNDIMGVVKQISGVVSALAPIAAIASIPLTGGTMTGPIMAAGQIAGTINAVL